ncbi:hypothetical protein J4E85_005406 [Alternaria conjuncta]|uniref:uncharacterized protein n=1 Tax=Alternaria conjuncta TaxID=181017 RepID=UPI00221F9A4A|nr:uncharacterized protein J4E85_005406 [Alternaria conjuncta]KAI4928785.1 hypothetical protein J4E85_005406 [Alternaria conjuncta]
MEFILPPSLDTALDISNALNYTIGEKITVYWTEAPAGTAVSIILWQADPETGVSIKNVEYILQSVVNRTNQEWIIRPEINLKLSNLFQLALYREGATVPADFSRYFYLEDKSESTTRSSSSLLPSTSLSSASTASSPSSATANSTPTSTPTTTPPSTPAPVPISSAAPRENSFPTSAKIGIGVGIPVALIIGLVVGFLLFRRHRKKDVTPSPMPGTQIAEQYKNGPNPHAFNNNSGYYAPPLNEAPPESLVELDPQHAHKPPTDGAAPARYEM